MGKWGQPWFNDTDLAKFKGCGTIESLRLHGTRVTDESIELILGTHVQKQNPNV